MNKPKLVETLIYGVVIIPIILLASRYSGITLLKSWPVAFDIGLLFTFIIGILAQKQVLLTDRRDLLFSVVLCTFLTIPLSALVIWLLSSVMSTPFDWTPVLLVGGTLAFFLAQALSNIGFP